MSDFKGRHFEGEIVLWAVRWYCRYGVSYRDLEQMIGERGVSVDHSTIYRWVQRYAPEIEKRLRWQWRGPRSASWRVDETYVKVRGRWAYLYRALDKHGNTIEFYLSPTRNTAAAKRFLGKALTGLKDWEKPSVINTDKAPTYAAALAELNHPASTVREHAELVAVEVAEIGAIKGVVMASRRALVHCPARQSDGMHLIDQIARRRDQRHHYTVADGGGLVIIGRTNCKHWTFASAVALQTMAAASAFAAQFGQHYIKEIPGLF